MYPTNEHITAKIQTPRCWPNHVTRRVQFNADCARQLWERRAHYLEAALNLEKRMAEVYLLLFFRAFMSNHWFENIFLSNGSLNAQTR